MTYSIITHRHRFAAWAASTAANVSTCRFSVEIGRAIIDELEIEKYLKDPNDLPDEQNFDIVHREWRRTAIRIANRKRCLFTHGVAAKLINIYFISGLICGGYHEHPKTRLLHPPIDRLILNELYERNIGDKRHLWLGYRNMGWSRFDCETYERLIMDIRSIMPKGNALWMIEEYWRGHQ